MSSGLGSLIAVLLVDVLEDREAKGAEARLGVHGLLEIFDGDRLADDLGRIGEELVTLSDRETRAAPDFIREDLVAFLPRVVEVDLGERLLGDFLAADDHLERARADSGDYELRVLHRFDLEKVERALT